MALTADLPTVPAAHASRRAWIRASIALFAVAWGGNEFTPLLVSYRLNDNLSAVAVDVLLGAYVLGIVPALLIGGPLSDRFGRRPLMLPAPALAAAGSAVLALAGGEAATLFAGRVLSGLALGLVMAAGTAWIKELSMPPFAAAPPAAGARRGALALTLGFGLGAGVAAALAQFGPLPETLPYLVNIALCLVGLGVILRAPETRRTTAPRQRLRDDLRVPAAAHRRFVLVVAPMAPWVFGTAASAYAILPMLLAPRVPGIEVGFAGLLCVIALGCGVVAQSVARLCDPAGGRRSILLSFGTTAAGMAVAGAASLTLSLPLAVLAAAVLGTAYGFLLVTGLREVQRIAGPDDLAGLTAVYYSLSYLGFFVPAVLAALSPVAGYPVLFGVGAVLAAVSLWSTQAAYRRHASEHRSA